MERYEKYKDSGIEWIGVIPEHWESKRIKYIISYQKGRNPKDLKIVWNENSEIYLAMDYLRDNPKQVYFVEDPENYVLVNENDILLLWDGSNAGEFIKSTKGILSSTMAVLYFVRIQKEYSYYFLKTFEKYLKESTIGMGIPHVNGEEFKNSLITIPTDGEQTTIATYLDRKTTEIDRIIANKQKLIALYEEEKQAIINQAVTKGLDSTVKLKDSGVEWLGEIPEHWDVKQFRHCITVLTDFTANGSFASLAENVTYYDSGYSRLIRLTDLRVDFENDGVYVDERAHNFLKKSELFGGEILIANVGAYAGLAILMPKPNGVCTLGPNMFLIRTNQNSNYITILLNSEFYKNQLRNIALSSAQPKLNKDDIKALVIPVPEIGEQEQILDYIEKECSKFNLLISKYTKQIELLKEYRTTLISEVVTGKIKVPNTIEA